MPKPRLDIEVKQEAIVIRTLDVPVKGWSIYSEDVDAVEFEDNCLDLFPGDEQVIVAHGIHKQQLSYRYYGMKEDKAVAIDDGSTETYKLAKSLNANL
ncbi:hypothetical protein EIK77_007591 [Talaromyces pinophilus]|nr:hypothetical protein EIK77_007591 [Talaromyces pinophilus]